MLHEIRFRFRHLSNNSDTSGIVSENVFDMCNNFEKNLYIWVSFMLLCFIFGFPATVANLWEMFQTQRRGTPLTPNRFFMLNLCVMDVVSLAYIPPGLLNYFIWRIWVLEAIWNGITTLSVCGRPLLMACVCLDCYLAVVHPVTYHNRKSLGPRVVMVGIVWILTVVYGIVAFFFYKLFLHMVSTVPFMAAIVITGVCDSFILHTLVKSGPGKKNIHSQKQRAIQTLINSLVMTVFSYLPPVFLLAIGKSLINDDKVLECTIGIPMTIIYSFGSAIMPILQLNNNGKLDRFLKCCRKS
ncbi:Proteinase-activated receptor 3 [Collichthys lucidus]|uniref:Proteinase-activated receptor 3 n=1 Tax=Collichthys lucidus TaxID=240159 RepID=A0A4U5VMZ8_COLLU|nr:Proteinase-activated receptor 3 [Collichthys lucidus]